MKATIPTILYVDDEQINVMLFELNFKDKYHVLTALNALDGMNTIIQNPQIQVVISDMKMPEINGLDFIRQVKEIYPEKPCFILTGYDITPEIQHAIETKIIKQYLSKPFVVSQIDIALQNVISTIQ